MPQNFAESRSLLSTCLKQVKNVVALSTRSVAKLLPISNTTPGVLSASSEPRSKHYINLRQRNIEVKKILIIKTRKKKDKMRKKGNYQDWQEWGLWALQKLLQP